MSGARETLLAGVGRLLSACALAAAPALGQTWFVDGTVTAGSVTPLSGITVAAYTLAGTAVATGSSSGSGQYRLALPAGSYRILAYDANGVWATSFFSGASSFETSAQIDLKANLAGVDFQMVRGASVTGRVSSALGGALSGMTVAAYNPDGTRRGFQKTGAGGAYAVLLPPGTYRMAAYDDNLGYATGFYLGQTSYDAATPVTVASAPVPNVDFTLVPAARVFGSTSDSRTRLPISGLTASAYTIAGVLVGNATSGANGVFSMAVPPGSVKFAAFDPAGTYALSFFNGAPTFASAPSFALTAGQTLTGIDFLLGPVVPPDTPTTLFVPAAVNLPGAGGTYFQTDLWITNPSDAALTVALTWLPSGQDNSARPGTPVAVPARSQVAFTNVVQSVAGTTGAGSLKLAASAPFLATSRTYNAASPPGTYGVGVAGRPLAASVSRGLIAGLSNTSSFRSNVAVMNPQPIPLTVTLALYRADGTPLGQGTRTLAPLDWFQASTVFSFLGVASTESNAYVTVSSTNGSFFAYGSVVDQTTGDGTVVEAAGY
jgi:hypothetical protein